MDKDQLKLLESLKSELRSILISSPAQMTMRDLCRDYRNLNGEDIPHQRLGYRNLTVFLKERCGDVMKFSGVEGNILTPIITENLKHIDDMISKQRNSGKKPWFRQRSRVVLDSPTRSPAGSYRISGDAYTNSNPSSPAKRWTPTPLSQESSPYRSASNGYSNSSTPKYSDHKSTSFDKRESDYDSRYRSKDEGTDRSGTVYNAYGEFDAQADDRQTERCSSRLEENSEMKRPCSRLTGSSGRGSLEKSKSDKIADRIISLVNENPKGMWMRDLPDLYSAKFNGNLDYSREGYSSLAAMCIKLVKEEVTLHRPSELGDFMLLPPGVPPPPAAYDSPSDCDEDDMRRTQLGKLSDALPGIPYDKEVFPEHCLLYSDNIARIVLDRRLGPGAVMAILVTQVTDPSHFWFQIYDPAHSDAVDVIMNEMEVFYTSEEGEKLRLMPCAIRAGHFCAAIYGGDWHRAVIVMATDKIIKVRYVDYGTVGVVTRPALELRHLLRRFASLPQQALRGRLARLRPHTVSGHWSADVCKAFYLMVPDRIIHAEVHSVDYDEQIVSMFLTDTTGKDDVRINDEILNGGEAALACKQKDTDKVRPIYLKTSFEEMENGLALTFSERQELFTPKVKSATNKPEGKLNDHVQSVKGSPEDTDDNFLNKSPSTPRPIVKTFKTEEDLNLVISDSLAEGFAVVSPTVVRNPATTLYPPPGMCIPTPNNQYPLPTQQSMINQPAKNSNRSTPPNLNCLSLCPISRFTDGVLPQGIPTNGHPRNDPINNNPTEYMSSFAYRQTAPMNNSQYVPTYTQNPQDIPINNPRCNQPNFSFPQNFELAPNVGGYNMYRQNILKSQDTNNIGSVPITPPGFSHTSTRPGFSHTSIRPGFSHTSPPVGFSHNAPSYCLNPRNTPVHPQHANYVNNISMQHQNLNNHPFHLWSNNHHQSSGTLNVGASEFYPNSSSMPQPNPNITLPQPPIIDPQIALAAQISAQQTLSDIRKKIQNPVFNRYFNELATNSNIPGLSTIINTPGQSTTNTGVDNTAKNIPQSSMSSNCTTNKTNTQTEEELLKEQKEFDCMMTMMMKWLVSKGMKLGDELPTASVSPSSTQPPANSTDTSFQEIERSIWGDNITPLKKKSLQDVYYSQIEHFWGDFPSVAKNNAQTMYRQTTSETTITDSSQSSQDSSDGDETSVTLSSKFTAKTVRKTKTVGKKVAPAPQLPTINQNRSVPVSKKESTKQQACKSKKKRNK